MGSTPPDNAPQLTGPGGCLTPGQPPDETSVVHGRAAAERPVLWPRHAIMDEKGTIARELAARFESTSQELDRCFVRAISVADLVARPKTAFRVGPDSPVRPLLGVLRGVFP